MFLNQNFSSIGAHSCSLAQSRLNAQLWAQSCPPFLPAQAVFATRSLRIGNPDLMVNTLELQESRWNKRERGTSLKESFCAITPSLMSSLQGPERHHKHQQINYSTGFTNTNKDYFISLPRSGHPRKKCRKSFAFSGMTSKIISILYLRN